MIILNKQKLYDLIDKYFSLEEIRNLVFFLGIRHDELPSHSKEDLIRGFILYVQRRHMEDELFSRLIQVRPQVNWEIAFEAPAMSVETQMPPPQPGRNLNPIRVLKEVVEDVILIPIVKGIGAIGSGLEKLRKSPDVTVSNIPYRIDAALPSKVEIHKSFELGVSIRQPDSPKLEAKGLDKLESGDLSVQWPEDAESIKLRVHVSAPECVIHDEDNHSFRLYKQQDTPVYYFQLTPQQTGRIGIVLTVYQEQDWLGGTRLDTESRERVVGGVETVTYSQPLGAPRNAQVAVAMEIEMRFELPELKTLSFDLGIIFDNLRGEIHAEKSRALVNYMVRHGRFVELLNECKKRRPNVDWEKLAGIVPAAEHV